MYAQADTGRGCLSRLLFLCTRARARNWAQLHLNMNADGFLLDSRTVPTQSVIVEVEVWHSVLLFKSLGHVSKVN